MKLLEMTTIACVVIGNLQTSRLKDSTNRYRSGPLLAQRLQAKPVGNWPTLINSANFKLFKKMTVLNSKCCHHKQNDSIQSKKSFEINESTCHFTGKQAAYQVLVRAAARHATRLLLIQGSALLAGHCRHLHMPQPAFSITAHTNIQLKQLHSSFLNLCQEEEDRLYSTRFASCTAVKRSLEAWALTGAATAANAHVGAAGFRCRGEGEAAAIQVQAVCIGHASQPCKLAVHILHLTLYLQVAQQVCFVHTSHPNSSSVATGTQNGQQHIQLTAIEQVSIVTSVRPETAKVVYG